MVNGIKTIYFFGLNEGFSLRFSVGSQLSHNTPEEGQRVYWLKHCEYYNEDNSPNILSDKIYKTLS